MRRSPEIALSFWWVFARGQTIICVSMYTFLPSYYAVFSFRSYGAPGMLFHDFRFGTIWCMRPPIHRFSHVLFTSVQLPRFHSSPSWPECLRWHGDHLQSWQVFLLWFWLKLLSFSFIAFPRPSSCWARGSVLSKASCNWPFSACNRPISTFSLMKQNLSSRFIFAFWEGENCLSGVVSWESRPIASAASFSPQDGRGEFAAAIYQSLEQLIKSYS
jgi:hypothetical protein